MLTRLALSPLLKTMAMNIVTACSLAPEDIFTFLELHDTNWTITFDGFARTTFVGT